MYRFKGNLDTMLIMRSNNWKVVLRRKKGHIHAEVQGEKRGVRFRQRGLTSICDRLTRFEERVVALHLRQKAMNLDSKAEHITHTNYADVFGAGYE